MRKEHLTFKKTLFLKTIISYLQKINNFFIEYNGNFNFKHESLLCSF